MNDATEHCGDDSVRQEKIPLVPASRSGMEQSTSSNDQGESQAGGSQISKDEMPRNHLRHPIQQHLHHVSVVDATIAMSAATIAESQLPPPRIHQQRNQQSCSSSTRPDVVPLDRSPQQQQQQFPSMILSGAPSITPESLIVAKSVATQERENFLMFIKILFKILDDAQEPHTKQKAKRIVLECRRKNQLGDPNFNPLMDAVESRLRQFVGESSWRRAHLFLHHYIHTRRAKVIA
jgi:hypothetical protein